MKTKHAFILLTTLLSVTILAFNEPSKISVVSDKKIELDKVSETLINMESKRFQERKSDILSKLKVYNPNAKEKTAENILNAIEAYSLDKSPKVMNYCIYQLLYESSGFHYKNGKLLTSTSNALGIAQIKAETGFYYLKQLMTQEEMDSLIDYGATKIKFSSEDKVSKKITDDGSTIWITPEKTKNKIRTWLKSEKNSTLLWAYIMNRSINKYGLHNALVIYNTGKGTWMRLRKANVDIGNHSYIRGIKRIEKKLKAQKKGE